MTLAGRLERKAFTTWHRHVLAYLPRTFAPSTQSVAIIMPLATKDLQRAEYALERWRGNLLHPIESVIVPGQSSVEIAAFCERVGARYIDETTVLPDAIKKFDYRPRGNGWIRQQILKLMADEFTPAEKLLMIDSDTWPNRPIAFMHDDKPVLYISDEYEPTYRDSIDRLFGPLRHSRRSFIAHCMLFERDVLGAMKRAIEGHCRKPWQDAILSALDPAVECCFSEYETYGHYVMNFRPDRFQTEYWYNAKDNGRRNLKRYNFVSVHIRPLASPPRRASVPSVLQTVAATSQWRRR
jgi:Family of unknown function (DUF6492)